MVAIGLVGVGNMGRNHLRVLSQLKGCELKGVSDANPEAGKLAKEYGVPFFSSLGEMMKAVKLDAVDVVVPTVLHAKVALECIRAGKHVFVEKPIAGSVREAGEMVKGAAGRGRVLMVGHVERFNPAVRALKRALSGEELVSLSFTRVGPVPPRQADVGVILDMGIHDLDLFRHLSGKEAEAVYCAASGEEKVESRAQILLQAEGGLSAQFTFNWKTPFKVRRIEAVTKAKVFSADLLTGEVRAFYGFSGGTKSSFITDQIPAPYTEPLFAELCHFCECVKSGKEPLASGKDAIEALRIAEAAIESAKSGKLVRA